ncbi:MAG: acyl-CoA desaturase [Candidatus Nanopelagicales bacterium]
MTLTPDLHADTPGDDELTGQSYAAGRDDVLASLGADEQSVGMRALVAVFIIVPLLAVLLAIPVAWGGWLGWSDIVLLVVFYVITGLGITMGYHRHFTHGAFKAKRPLRITLAIAGSLAIQGSVARWVADHRKHHAFSDAEGDPHSPWRYGTSARAVAKGLWYSHVGWLLEAEQSPIQRYAPDLAKDPDLVRISRAFPWLVATSLLLPAVLGGLITWSWQGALTAFFWAGLVRIALIHHVTWSINSICHVWGKHPFKTRDRAGNVAWLALPSFGESWHNLHHAEPTAARQGVLRGQVDVSGRLIRVCERFGWAYDVKWAKPERLEAKKLDDVRLGSVR